MNEPPIPSPEDWAWLLSIAALIGWVSELVVGRWF